MRAVVQEFLDLLSVALVIPRGVLQCRFHAALVVFVSWLFHSRFSLPSPSMESALLLLVLSFVLPRACLSHSCSCFHCVPTIFLLSGLVSFPHLAGLFLAMSCPSHQTASLSFLHRAMLQEVPGWVCRDVWARAVWGKGEMQRLMTCTAALCVCACAAGTWQ